ncbi:MAG: cysteine--tRNA ligase [Halofilum sp. (in: g-proteobacteria)]|nr:cysteine--tRNA ligase [Halofilum sp. (in: g-proteobacteria)]
MQIELHNTLTRRKETFKPIDPRRVTLYVCGPTVYNLVHIGNARPIVVFDVLFRLLRSQYPEVVYARNITDVDDKINAAAKENGEPIGALTARFTVAFHQDIAALNTLAPTIEPRATEHIPQMIAMIERLLADGHAYEAEGHVLFHVPSMPDYGRLSGHKREDLVAGARVEVAPYKKDPADFVLWKPSTEDLPGWDSPWGRGRPGWHLECSVMVEAHLGETIDIHGGGQDLIFPHHENELAQSQCAHHGHTFANYWLHNGYITVDGAKMAKSEGNFFTLREVLDQYPGEVVRFALLSAHYRQPLDWSPETAAQARAAVDRFYQALRSAADVEAENVEVPETIAGALADDLNTPLALRHLHECATALNKAGSDQERARLKGELLAGAGLLGLLAQDPEDWFRGDTGEGPTADEIERLIAERTAARRNRDFARADEIRDDLAARGVTLEDGPGGTTWRRTAPGEKA